MKNFKILSVFFVGLISVMLFPFDVSAKSISTLNVKENNNKFTVSGTTENGVLAVAVLVYSENNLLHMESCSVSENSYSCELNKSFSIGNYAIKVADYDGGNYVTKDVSITKSQEIINNEENPKTFDEILLYVELGFLSIIGLMVLGIYLKKEIVNRN